MGVEEDSPGGPAGVGLQSPGGGVPEEESLERPFFLRGCFRSWVSPAFTCGVCWFQHQGERRNGLLSWVAPLLGSWQLSLACPGLAPCLSRRKQAAAVCVP